MTDMTQKDQQMMNGTCHCGVVHFKFHGHPTRLVVCNCSICSRLRPLWAYGRGGVIEITKGVDQTMAYVWGDKSLAFHSCKTCGCTAHWKGLSSGNPQNMAVNMALCVPSEIREIPLRHFDGADTWTFLD